MDKRNYILDIPGDTEDNTTERGRFVEELSDLVVFRPGTSFGFGRGIDILRFPSAEFIYGEGTWIDTERGRQNLDGRWWTELVSQDSLHKLEGLLQKYGVDFVRDTNAYSLCCDETTEESESLFLFNYYGEKLLFVSSPVQLFSSRAVAYLPEFTQDDERLERALVESMIDFRDNTDVYAPHTSYNLFPSEEEARRHIQNHLEDDVKRCLTGYGETYDAVILTDSNSDSDEELIFPEGTEITEQTKVIHSNMWLPKIVKAYPDGKVLVEGQQENLPLSQYFDKREGIKTFNGVGACERCYTSLKDRLKEDARMEVITSKWDDLTGPTADRIGYVFDPSRIKVRIIRKNPIKIYKEEIASHS